MHVYAPLQAIRVDIFVKLSTLLVIRSCSLDILITSLFETSERYS